MSRLNVHLNDDELTAFTELISLYQLRYPRDVNNRSTAVRRAIKTALDIEREHRKKLMLRGWRS